MPKSPGNRKIYRDTISRCNLYSNPYDTHMTSHPALVRQRAEEYARSKDVIESVQKQLERDLMQRLLLKLPTGKFVLVAQLGKYTFLAIMLPPYIFLYGLPKWLMTEGMPWIFNIIKKRVKTLHFGVNRHLKITLQSIQKPIFALLQAAKNRIDKAQDGVTRLAQKAYKVVTYPWNVIKEKLVRPFLKAYQFIETAIKKINVHRHNLFDAVKEIAKRARIRSDLVQFLRDKASSLFKTPRQLFRNFQTSFSQAYRWTAEKMEKLKQFPERIFERFKKKIQKFHGTAIKKPTELIMRSLERMQDFAKKKYQRALKRISEWTEPFFNIMQRIISRRKNWNEVMRKFKREGIIEGCKQAGREFGSSCKRGIKVIAKIIAEFSADLIQLLPIPVVAVFNPFLYIAKTIIRVPSKIYKSRNNFIQKLKHIKDGFLGAVKWIYSGIKHLISKIRNVYNRLKSKVKKILVKAASFLVWLFSLCWEALKRLVYLIRLMFAWAKVSFKYGMLFVRESTQKLLKI
jgi:hypothetical protein